MKSRKIKIALMGIVAIAALGAVVMLLWNLLIPTIFGLTTINFWQALGLFALARILFGFGRGPMMHNRMHGMGNNPIHKKWMKMTPEQRKEFIERRKQFGFGGPFGRNPFEIHNDEEQGKGNE